MHDLMEDIAPNLKEALDRMDARLQLEKIRKRVPAVDQLIREHGEMAQIMTSIANIVQEVPLEIAVNPDTGKTENGMDPEHALEIVKRAFTLMRDAAIRYM